MKNVLRYSVTAAVGLVIALVVMLAKDLFGQSSTEQVMRILCDAFFVPGVCLTGAGLIVLASNGGAFYMLSYGVRFLFFMFKDVFTGGKAERKYKDYYEYRKAKSEQKRSVAFMLIVGVGFLAVSVIFLICYYNV